MARADDPTQNAGDVDVVDEDVRHEVGSVAQRLQQVGADDVAGAGLIRREIVERVVDAAQRPLAAAVDARADVVRTHDGALQLFRLHHVHNRRNIHEHVVVALEHEPTAIHDTPVLCHCRYTGLRGRGLGWGGGFSFPIASAMPDLWSTYSQAQRHCSN